MSTLPVPNDPAKKKRRSSADIRETLNAVYVEAPDGKRTLNQYVLQHTLGRGAYGTVYYGLDMTDPDDPEPVAIKEFSKSKLRRQKLQKEGGTFGLGRRLGRGRGRGAPAAAPSTRPGAADRASELCKSGNPIDLVRGEIAIFKKLDHPNVIKLFEVLDDPDQDSLYMVFELCSGGPITDVTQDKSATPLAEERARILFRQMILGIEYLHEHDIAHRDIKPDNMLTASDGTLKIVDFGVSEMFSPSNDKLRTSAGSPAFSAPEVCVAHHGAYSARASDIWAMGVTLYCMVFGVLPFRGDSIVDLYEHIVSETAPIPESTTPLLRDLLERLLEKDPTKRITMDQLREHPWVTCGGSVPLLPTKEQNCKPIPDISEEDINTAVKAVYPLFTLLKAVNKLKKLVKPPTPIPANGV